MEELPPVLASLPEQLPPPAMSLAARLLNVFAIPGEVFQGVTASRISIGNWLVPMILSGAILALMAAVVVSQPVIQRQMHDHLEQEAKALQKQAAAGKAKQADVDRTVAFTRAIVALPVLRILVGGAAAVIGVARVLWWALVLWLLGRLFLKVRLKFLKTLEVAGLGLMIAVLGGVVMLLLMVNVPKLLGEPGVALAASDAGPLRESPVLLAVTNVFSFWLIGVLSVGLARLAKVPFLRAAWFVFAFWLVQESVLILLGGALGQLAV